MHFELVQFVYFIFKSFEACASVRKSKYGFFQPFKTPPVFTLQTLLFLSMVCVDVFSYSRNKRHHPVGLCV